MPLLCKLIEKKVRGIMKLVIDITEEDYGNIEPFLNGQTIKGGFNLFKVLEMIKNGVPFDDMPFNEVKIDTLRLERYYSSKEE